LEFERREIYHAPANVLGKCTIVLALTVLLLVDAVAAANLALYYVFPITRLPARVSADGYAAVAHTVQNYRLQLLQQQLAFNIKMIISSPLFVILPRSRRVFSLSCLHDACALLAHRTFWAHSLRLVYSSSAQS